MLDWAIAARGVHVLGVVVWLGGVWFVTMIHLPGLRRHSPERWLDEFEALEAGFAPQARIALLLVLLSGLWMTEKYDLWDRFLEAQFWWMHLMVAVWALFALMLFVIEPLLLERLVRRYAATAPAATLAVMLWLHRMVLVLALVATFAAVGGAHGLF